MFRAMLRLAFFPLRLLGLSRKPSGQSVGLQMTKEEIELERKFNEERMGLIESALFSSGYLKPEKIQELMKILRSATVPFGRINTSVVFSGDTFLTVQEKKSLGLNTRSKYSHKFIGYSVSKVSQLLVKIPLHDLHSQ